MIKIILCLLLTGRAAGSVTDPDSLKEPDPIPQREAPKEDGGEDAGIRCVAIKSLWGGNCNVVIFKCSDNSFREDGKCYPPDWEIPWKNTPDPPFANEVINIR